MSNQITPSRRNFLAGGLGAAGLAALAACSSGSGGSAGSTPSGSSSPSGGPTTITHKYGATTVPANPKRVITLGYTDQEPMLALGVPPVGVVDFFGERPYGKWPWEKTRWKGTTPQIVGDRDDYQFEKIAALKPDLIVGLYSGMTAANYRTLSGIAPTVAQPKGYLDFSAPWEVITTTAGKCVGQEPLAQRLVASVQAQFAAQRSAHPEWKGKTVAVAEPFKPAEWAVFGASDPKLQFMTELGYVVAPSVRRLEPGGDVPSISTERLELLDVDQLVLLIDTSDQSEVKVKANPLFAKLAVARDDRTIFLPFGQDPPIGAALAFNSVLSIPYGISHVTAALIAQ